ncbi:hypothetical protein L6452_15173 [Arctium lappa]|uniref:Uncharacterized protein n=1 Tax=Arctium lappa TaxID=4217 RepID=A0ACB9CN80_ARCLA|nr:hypothetical protein L6452_15173 [Arctium lappa]
MDMARFLWNTRSHRTLHSRLTIFFKSVSHCTAAPGTKTPSPSKAFSSRRHLSLSFKTQEQCPVGSLPSSKLQRLSSSR